MRELNGFWLFVSSCLPGCGQMYQGYMKRGASLLILFWVTVGVTTILNLGALGVLIAIEWLYAYFDSYNLRTLEKESRPMPDAYLFGEDEKGFMGITIKKGHKVLGWVLVIVGGYSLLTIIANMLADQYGLQELSNALNYIVPKVILTVLIILLGVWFIRGPKQKAESPIDFEAYVPSDKKKEEGKDE